MGYAMGGAETGLSTSQGRIAYENIKQIVCNERRICPPNVTSNCPSIIEIT